MKKKWMYFLFFIIIAGVLIEKVTGAKWLDYLFKSLIMPWMAGFFMLHARNVDFSIRKLILLGFLFSWLGDISLMFTHFNELFFLTGIGCFLIALVFYVFLFLRTINLSGKRAFLKKQPYWIIAYLGYGLIFYILLFNHLDTLLQFAILLYVTVLLGMSAMALNRFGNGHPLSFSFVFAGSLLFVASDSMIALNKYLVEIPYDGIWIMSTYIGAQYLIMRGILKQYEEPGKGIFKSV
jgi:uncharacterized membrane protein YhhN